VEAMGLVKNNSNISQPWVKHNSIPSGGILLSLTPEKKAFKSVLLLKSILWVACLLDRSRSEGDTGYQFPKQSEYGGDLSKKKISLEKL